MKAIVLRSAALAVTVSLASCGGGGDGATEVPQQVTLQSGATVQLPGKVEQSSTQVSGLDVGIWTGDTGDCAVGVSEFALGGRTFDLDGAVQGAFNNVLLSSDLHVSTLNWLGADARDLTFKAGGDARSIRARIVRLDDTVYQLNVTCKGNEDKATNLFDPLIASFTPPA